MLEGYAVIGKEYGVALSRAGVFDLSHELWEALKLIWNLKQSRAQAEAGTVSVIADGT